MNKRLTRRVVPAVAGALLPVVVFAATGDAATGTPVGLTDVSCSDSTSDAATLQGAIDASAVGSTIQIGGTCLLTSGITLLGDRTYIGDSRTGTVLKQDASLGYVLASDAYVDNWGSTGDPITVRDLTVQCNSTGTTDGLIVLAWDVDVEHVEVSDCGGSGIVDTAIDQAGVQIGNSSVNSRFDDDFIQNSGQYGFDVADHDNSVTDGFFRDNQVAYSKSDAVHLDNCAGWAISGNHLYNDSQNAVYCSRLYGATIADNYIEDFGLGQSSGTYYGIDTSAQGDSESVISGNKISDGPETAGADHTFIAVASTNYGTGVVTVTGNALRGGGASTDVGFFYSGGSNQLLVTSSGNAVAGIATARSTDSTVTLSSGI